jgi:hypothetical protein
MATEVALARLKSVRFQVAGPRPSNQDVFGTPGPVGPVALAEPRDELEILNETARAPVVHAMGGGKDDAAAVGRDDGARLR